MDGRLSLGVGACHVYAYHRVTALPPAPESHEEPETLGSRAPRPLIGKPTLLSSADGPTDAILRSRICH